MERRERKERFDKWMPGLVVAFTAIFQLMSHGYLLSPEWYAGKVEEAMEQGAGAYNIDGNTMMTISDITISDVDNVDGFYFECWQTPATVSIRSSLSLL